MGNPGMAPPSNIPAPSQVISTNTITVSPTDPAADESDLAVAVAGAVTGDVIFVYPGTYTLTADLDMPADGISLIGVGGAERTLLVAGDANFTQVGMATGSLVQGISIDHSGATGRGFNLTGNGSRLVDCIINVSGAFGDPDHAVTEGAFSTGDHQISGLVISGTFDLSAISLAGGALNGAIISDVRFVNCTAPIGVATELAATTASISDVRCIDSSNAIATGISVIAASTLHATDCQIGSTSAQDIHVLGNFNGSGIIALGSGGSEAILIDGGGAFVQLAGFMHADPSEIAVANGADHNNFILDPGHSNFGPVTSGTWTASVSFGQAWDGKPVSAILGAAEAGVRVDSAVWDGSGNVDVTLSANTTANRKVFVAVHSFGYGA